MTPSRRKNDAKGAVVIELSPGITTLAERVSPIMPPGGFATPISAAVVCSNRVRATDFTGDTLRPDPGEHTAPNKLHGESTLTEHMRKGNRQI
jgi:hypothetical protein